MERRATWVRVCHSWEEAEAADREYWRTFSGEEKVAMIPELHRRWEVITNMSRDGARRSDNADLLEALHRHGARFMIVGAYAVAFHAQPRYTEDFDILVEATHENGEAIVRALDDFGFAELKFSPSDFAEKGRVIQRGYKPNRIDFLTSIVGIDFAEAWSRRVAATFEGVPVHYLSKPDLIRSKEAAGRPKDLMDLEFLR